jgi:hypothetical protein
MPPSNQIKSHSIVSRFLNGGRWVSVLSLITAVVAWTALALQLTLIIEKMTSEGDTVVVAIWRFFGFFTILSNITVALVATAMVFRNVNALTRLSTVSAIAFVGIVYSVALRATWQPEGWQAVADHMLHDATPVLFVVAWLCSEHGTLQWRDAAWAIVAPMAYCIYALIRGAGDGWYAYWFLNPTQLDGARMVASIAALSVSFIILSLVFIAIDRKLAR